MTLKRAQHGDGGVGMGEGVLELRALLLFLFRLRKGVILYGTR